MVCIFLLLSGTLKEVGVKPTHRDVGQIKLDCTLISFRIQTFFTLILKFKYEESDLATT